MSEESADLRLAVADLRNGIGDLKVTVAELKITVANIGQRDAEDRISAGIMNTRMNSLERWRSWIQGQMALVSFIAGGTLILVLARIFHAL